MKSVVAVLTLAPWAMAQTSGLDHYNQAEVFFAQNNLQSAANEYREALNARGSSPRWVEVWSRIQLGRIFERTNQRDRAIAEFCNALATNDDHRGALAEAKRYLQALNVVAEPARWNRPDLRNVPVETLHLPEAPYTPQARDAQLEGRVWITGVVETDGTLGHPAVARGLGMGLDENALEAVRLARFQPGHFDGRDVPAKVTVGVDFVLPDHASRWHFIGFDCEGPKPPIRSVVLPPGAGISVKAADHAQVIAMLKRVATVELSFTIDPAGHPAGQLVEASSDTLWEAEAAAVLARWQFEPPAQAESGKRCRATLLWGPRQLTAAALRQLPPDHTGPGGEQLSHLRHPRTGCAWRVR